MCEKYLGKGRDLYMVLVDLEKYVMRLIEMWCSKYYKFIGQVLRAEKSYYKESKVYMKGNMYFPVRVVLRQWCVMLSSPFSIFVDGVVRKVKVRVKKLWVRVMYGVERKLEGSQLLFADNTALVVDGRDLGEPAASSYRRSWILMSHLVPSNHWLCLYFHVMLVMMEVIDNMS